jgi:hypothetical protein
MLRLVPWGTACALAVVHGFGRNLARENAMSPTNIGRLVLILAAVCLGWMVGSLVPAGNTVAGAAARVELAAAPAPETAAPSDEAWQLLDRNLEYTQAPGAVPSQPRKSR